MNVEAPSIYKQLYNDSAVPVAQLLWDFRLHVIMWLDGNIKATNLSKHALYDMAVHNSISLCNVSHNHPESHVNKLLSRASQSDKKQGYKFHYFYERKPSQLGPTWSNFKDIRRKKGRTFFPVTVTFVWYILSIQVFNRRYFGRTRPNNWHQQWLNFYNNSSVIVSIWFLELISCPSHEFDRLNTSSAVLGAAIYL